MGMGSLPLRLTVVHKSGKRAIMVKATPALPLVRIHSDRLTNAGMAAIGAGRCGFDRYGWTLPHDTTLRNPQR